MKTLLALFALAATALAQAPAKPKPDPAMQPVTDDTALPRVLLIGDSISIGYTVAVREALKGKANVHRPLENCNSTKDGIEKLDQWLATGGARKWDVIHFNWGLHDLKHAKDGKLDLEGPQLIPVGDYEKNLRDLLAKLKATGAKLIWATTTPVPAGSAGRVAGDELTYNQAAERIMIEAAVAIDDLHGAAKAKLAEWQIPRNVHFNPAGSRGLGVQVAEKISAALAK